MERATGTEVFGCGSSQTSDITLNIQTTTGGNFSISLNVQNTVEHLKKIVSKKLKVSKDRICLLHRERQLRDGTLEDNGLFDGSRVILLPSVETGLLSQRPENSVMQALESLNDSQVNDFLSGKSPLNLTMRLGDHMMLIQLQLSTLNSSSAGSRSLRTSTPTKSSAAPSTSLHTIKCDGKETPVPQDSSQKSSGTDENATDSDMNKGTQTTHIIDDKDLEILQNAFELYRTMTQEKEKRQLAELLEDKENSAETSNCTLSDLSDTSAEHEQSPIKSLSNLVSSPLNPSMSAECREGIINKLKNNLLDLLTQNSFTEVETPSNCVAVKHDEKLCSSMTSDSSLSDDSGDNFTDQSSFLAESTIDEYPMENLFNSAVDKGLFADQEETMMDREISNLATTSHGSQESNTAVPSFQSMTEPGTNKRFQYLLHKTSKLKHPIVQNKQKAFMQSVVNKHKKRMQKRQENKLAQPSTSRTEHYIKSRKLILQPSQPLTQTVENPVPSTSKNIPPFRAPDIPKKSEASQKLDTLQKSDIPKKVDAPKKSQRASPTPAVDTKALIEASKNLTQKLKKLSKEVLTNKIDLRTAEETVRSKLGSGAVIESMKHHGKGIYSGTFSGTLNPALQDRYGRPKRDISTIIHILNDLLCATPPITLSSKDSKHSCTASTSEDSHKCTGCSQLPCSYGQCEGHATGDKACRCERQECQCPRLEPSSCSACTGNTHTGEMCKKCDTAKMLALENSKTKCKLEQLRLVMQQKKQRREARKLKTLPYANAPPKTHSSPDQQAIQEEIETVA